METRRFWITCSKTPRFHALATLRCRRPDQVCTFSTSIRETREIKCYFNIWGIRKKKKEGSSEKRGGGGVENSPISPPLDPRLCLGLLHLEQRKVCSYMGPSCSKISTNLRLNFNPGFFSFYPKAFSQISFSILLRSSNHHIGDKKNLTERFLSFQSWIQIQLH